MLMGDDAWRTILIPLNILNLKGKPWWVVPVVRFMHCCAMRANLDMQRGREVKT